MSKGETRCPGLQELSQSSEAFDKYGKTCNLASECIPMNVYVMSIMVALFCVEAQPGLDKIL